jgi:hypothetical protein
MCGCFSSGMAAASMGLDPSPRRRTRVPNLLFGGWILLRISDSAADALSLSIHDKLVKAERRLRAAADAWHDSQSS